MMKNILGHHGLSQLVNEDTWSRTVNGVRLSSRIDHVYTNANNRVADLKLVNNAYSDHEMVELILLNSKTKWQNKRMEKKLENLHFLHNTMTNDK